ncbi:hypothetical protein GSI_11340 [Ganoderma sinense ZZ0214-1]|uniref:Uncharacterized protein n=1 Tax=Ganoderma sinense ZZ0214-1 TaxID=1077348 RepID=A0A2G8RVQ7_9APHY|nr:hypothetical protein GSI_11340 [Ganoderma sinense ZZ0214-1]
MELLSQVPHAEDVEPITELDREREDDNGYGAAVESVGMPPMDSFLPSRSKVVEVPPPPTQKEITLSKMPTELSHRTSARTSPPQLLPCPPGVTKYTKAPFAVRPIADSWETLPRLGGCLRNGEYAIVNPPHEDPTPARLKALLSYGIQDVPLLTRLDEQSAGPLPPSAARPVTPEPHQFTFRSDVIRLARNTKVKFDEIASLEYEMKLDTAVLHARAVGVIERHHDAITQLGPAGEALVTDIGDAFHALERVNEVLIRLTGGFKNVPSMPWNWDALLDLLTKVDELRDLYATAWSRFNVLEEDMRPVCSEVHHLQHNVASVQDCLDGITNKAIKACEPLLHNLYKHLATKLEDIEKRLGRLNGAASTPIASVQPDLQQVVAAITALSERIDRLEKSSGDGIVARIEATIGTYLTDRGLPDDVLRQLGTRFGYPPGPVEVGGSISDALHTIYPLCAWVRGKSNRRITMRKVWNITVAVGCSHQDSHSSAG